MFCKKTKAGALLCYSSWPARFLSPQWLWVKMWFAWANPNAQSPQKNVIEWATVSLEKVMKILFRYEKAPVFSSEILSQGSKLCSAYWLYISIFHWLQRTQDWKRRKTSCFFHLAIALYMQESLWGRLLTPPRSSYILKMQLLWRW